MFSKNFPVEIILGFFAFWIEENIDSWILFSFEFTANANRFLVPTRLLTRLKLFCLIFWKSKADVPSAFAVIPAISNLVETFFLIILISLDFFNLERTKGRPIPSKRIFPAEKARDFGLVLAGISIACAFGIAFTTSFWNGMWCGIFMVFGLADNILIYSHALKRKSQLNIILGGFSGGAPAMIGYAAVTLTGLWDFGLIMAGLVFIVHQ